MVVLVVITDASIQNILAIGIGQIEQLRSHVRADREELAHARKNQVVDVVCPTAV